MRTKIVLTATLMILAGACAEPASDAPRVAS
jgi:hypothetical protein